MQIPESVLPLAMELSRRYLSDHQLLDKAFDFLDPSCSRLVSRKVGVGSRCTIAFGTAVRLSGRMRQIEVLTCCVLFFQLLGCPEKHSFPTGAESQLSVTDANPRLQDVPLPVMDGGANVPRLDAAEPPIQDTATNAPSPGDAPRKMSKADLAQLRRCCRLIEHLGDSRGQEGVGYVSLSTICDDMAVSVEEGTRVHLNYSDWETLIFPGLKNKTIPSTCRNLMLSFKN